MRAWVLACLIAWWLPSSAADAPDTQPHQVLVLLAMPPPHFRPDGFYAGGYADNPRRSAGRRTATALARAYGLRVATDWPLPALGLDCYVMDVPPNLSPAEVADRLTAEKAVAWAQVMNVFRPLAHDDPLFDQQPAARDWQLARLHQWATGGGVRVAVIDSGVQSDHPDLAGQVTERLNLVANRPDAAEMHGTAVAGIIAARSDNRVGIAGVAPGAAILALRACWQAAPGEARCTSLTLAQALSAAIERDADVINLSLGGPADRLIQRLVEAALAHDITVVAATRNAAADGGFPAALPGVIAVADAAATRPRQAVLAPGTDVPTTLPGSRWGLVTGSSYAAAHVSGLVALLMDARSRDASRKGRPRAVRSTDLVVDGDGRVDACASLGRAAPCDRDCGCGSGAGTESHPVARR